MIRETRWTKSVKNEPFDADKLEKQVTVLMMDEDVTKKPGI